MTRYLALMFVNGIEKVMIFDLKDETVDVKALDANSFGLYAPIQKTRRVCYFFNPPNARRGKIMRSGCDHSQGKINRQRRGGSIEK